MLRIWNTYAGKQFTSACFCGVTIVLGKLGFEVRGGHVVFIGRVRVRIDRITLGHRGPHLGVAHHDHIKYAHFFISELVLAQFTEALVRVQHDIAGRGIEVAAQNFHEGGLAAAVSADQTITVAVAKFDGNVFKQGLRPKLHGDISGGKHCGNLYGYG